MNTPRIPSAKSIDKAAERLAKNAGVPVEAVNKDLLRKLAAKASETDPPLNLP